MRTDELRNLLHQHGDDVRDAGAPARITAVHQRVRAVRRRRVAVTGAGAVAAVAAIALAVVPNLSQQDPGPAHAPHELAGFAVPDTETAIGYTFEYARGVEKPAAAGSLRLTLPASDEPRLVKWASSASDDDRPVRVAVSSTEHDLERASGDFDGYEYLEPGVRHRVALEQVSPTEGELLALAVYELSDQRPDGVAGQGISFRAEQLDDRLVSAVIGEPGQAEVTTQIVVPDSDVRVTEVCFGPDGGLPSDYMAWLLLDGKPLWGSSCSEREEFDVGTDGSVVSDAFRRMGIEPGDTVELAVRLVDKYADGDGPLVSGADLVLAVAAYEQGGAVVGAAGWDFPQRYEHDGHVWSLASVDESVPGSRVHTAEVGPRDHPVLLVTGWTGVANRGRVLHSVDGEEAGITGHSTGAVGGSWRAQTVLEPGRRHESRLEVRRGVTDQTRLAIGFYELEH
jgi:hypothetical protein